MSSKKKIIYISIILVCLLGSVIVLMWGGGGAAVPEDTPTPVASTPETATPAARPAGDSSYPPPVVFPENTKLDTSFLNSQDFLILKPFNAVTLGEGELGRDDPFANY